MTTQLLFSDRQVLEALKKKTFRTPLEICEHIKFTCDPAFLLKLKKLKNRKLIQWSVGNYIRITTKGLEELNHSG